MRHRSAVLLLLVVACGTADTEPVRLPNWETKIDGLDRNTSGGFRIRGVQVSESGTVLITGSQRGYPGDDERATRHFITEIGVDGEIVRPRTWLTEVDGTLFDINESIAHVDGTVTLQLAPNDIRSLGDPNRLEHFGIDGELEWQSTLADDEEVIEATADRAGHVYLIVRANRENFVVKIDAATGEELWRAPFDADYPSALVASRAGVVVSSYFDDVNPYQLTVFDASGNSVALENGELENAERPTIAVHAEAGLLVRVRSATIERDPGKVFHWAWNGTLIEVYDADLLDVRIEFSPDGEPLIWSMNELVRIADRSVYARNFGVYAFGDDCYPTASGRAVADDGVLVVLSCSDGILVQKFGLGDPAAP